MKQTNNKQTKKKPGEEICPQGQIKIEKVQTEK
jgi:hypothetical protein